MPQLSVINLSAKSPFWMRSIVLLVDNAEPEACRLSRIWLKWGLKP